MIITEEDHVVNLRQYCFPDLVVYSVQYDDLRFWSQLLLANRREEPVQCFEPIVKNSDYASGAVVE